MGEDVYWEDVFDVFIDDSCGEVLYIGACIYIYWSGLVDVFFKVYVIYIKVFGSIFYKFVFLEYVFYVLRFYLE